MVLRVAGVRGCSEVAERGGEGAETSESLRVDKSSISNSYKPKQRPKVPQRVWTSIFPIMNSKEEL
jgi:hypothetical protein